VHISPPFLRAYNLRGIKKWQGQLFIWHHEFVYINIKQNVQEF
ncbi:unnamed protein product, partial [marine sediment metagenome]